MNHSKWLLLEINECEAEPCQNGATCNDLVGLYSCQCADGFEGDNCEIGTFYTSCSNLEKYPTKKKKKKKKKIDTDECASDPCLNGATCSDGMNEFVCHCTPEYTGSTCDTEVDECSSSPCENGNCIDGFGEFACQCHDGWAGSTCSININECASNPCVNGGTCVDQVNGFQCMCPDGFDGYFLLPWLSIRETKRENDS